MSRLADHAIATSEYVPALPPTTTTAEARETIPFRWQPIPVATQISTKGFASLGSVASWKNPDRRSSGPFGASTSILHYTPTTSCNDNITGLCKMVSNLVCFLSRNIRVADDCYTVSATAVWRKRHDFTDCNIQNVPVWYSARFTQVQVSLECLCLSSLLPRRNRKCPVRCSWPFLADEGIAAKPKIGWSDAIKQYLPERSKMCPVKLSDPSLIPLCSSPTCALPYPTLPSPLFFSFISTS